MLMCIIVRKATNRKCFGVRLGIWNGITLKDKLKYLLTSVPEFRLKNQIIILILELKSLTLRLVKVWVFLVLMVSLDAGLRRHFVGSLEID